MRLVTGALAMSIAVAALACEGEEEAAAPFDGTETPQGPGAPLATPCSRDDPACVSDSDTDTSGLTEEQQALAISIATQDATLQELLASVDYEIRGAGKWELRGDMVGAVVSIGLAQPIAIDQELPAIDIGIRGPEGNETYLPLAPPYYIERREPYEIEARSLSVNVDLHREKVVAIFPLPFAPN